MFAYDANGNRSSLTEDAVLYGYSNLANTNQLLSTTGPQPKTYSYDLAGNVTGDGVHTYGYDDRGRLIDVDAGAATYTYNGQGQRVSKASGTTTLFAYGEVGELLGEYDASGTAIQETVWFNGAPVALLDGTSTYYVHSDHLGTPRVISDGNTAIWRWESDPFGATLPDEDPDNDGTTLTYNVRFPGQYYDAETGLHYNYFRTYDPSTGRYLESDPIGQEGGLNTYGYVLQNPLSYSDALGLDRQISFGFTGTVQIGIPQLAWLGGGLGGGTLLGISIPDDIWNFKCYQAFARVQANSLVGVGAFAGAGFTVGTSTSDGPITSGSSTGIVSEGNFGWGTAGGMSFTSEGDVTNPSDWLNPITGASGTVAPRLGVGYGLSAGAGEYNATVFATSVDDDCECR